MLEVATPTPAVADEHHVVAEGLTELLAGSYDVVEVVYDGDALLEAARGFAVDAILSEVTMPHRSGLAVLRQLRADASRVPFVFVMHGEPAIAAAAMRAGASGYVLKASASTELIAALACVTQGATWISPSLAAESLGITQLQLRQLTGKQRDVLNRLSRRAQRKTAGARNGPVGAHDRSA